MTGNNKRHLKPKFNPDEYFIGTTGLIRFKHTKIDLKNNGFNIVYDNPPQIPGVTIKDFYGIIDLLNCFQEFEDILKKIDNEPTGKNINSKKVLFLQEIKKNFPKLPVDFIKSLYPVIEDRNYQGFSLHPGLKWSEKPSLVEKKYFKSRKDLFIKVGKKPFRSLVRDIIMLDFFNKNNGSKSHKLSELKKYWPAIMDYYELPELPDEEHLTRHLNRISNFLK